jgi:CRISPR-associated exonuclease Cas4
MFAEDDLRPISALQHLLFCERQCALIHVEQLWAENRYTAEGRVLHEAVDSGFGESRGDLRIARALPLRSLRLGLVGRADAVELRRVGDGEAPGTGAELPGVPGRWRPFPVEYKRGRPKRDRCDEVQLCAQALCLEEMLDVDVPEGALYYGKKRRRQPVTFDRALRTLTEETAERLHRLLDSGRTPPAVHDARCDRCSLLEICLPAAPEASARAYLDRLLGAGEEVP